MGEVDSFAPKKRSESIATSVMARVFWDATRAISFHQLLKGEKISGKQNAHFDDQ